MTKLVHLKQHCKNVLNFYYLFWKFQTDKICLLHKLNSLKLADLFSKKFRNDYPHQFCKNKKRLYKNCTKKQNHNQSHVYCVSYKRKCVYIKGTTFYYVINYPYTCTLRIYVYSKHRCLKLAERYILHNTAYTLCNIKKGCEGRP